METSTSCYVALESEEDVEAIMKPGGGAAVLDFWGEDCGPCRAMAPDFEHVASQFDPEEVKFCKVNTTTHGWLAAPFNIRSVPTILFVHDGQILDVVIGKMTAEALGRRAEWLLRKASKKPGLLRRLFGGGRAT